VTARFKVWGCGCSPAEIVGSNSGAVWLFFCCECFLLSSFCDRLITSLEESYRLWCVVVCYIETTILGRPWSALGCSATGTK